MSRKGCQGKDVKERMSRKGCQGVSWISTILSGLEIKEHSLNNIETQSKKYRKAEYVQRHVCFVNVQSSLHENVVFSVCARMCNAEYIIFIMWNSISDLDTCYHFRLNISCGVAVTEGGHL